MSFLGLAFQVLRIVSLQSLEADLHLAAWAQKETYRQASSVSYSVT